MDKVAVLMQPKNGVLLSIVKNDVAIEILDCVLPVSFVSNATEDITIDVGNFWILGKSENANPFSLLQNQRVYLGTVGFMLEGTVTTQPIHG